MMCLVASEVLGAILHHDKLSVYTAIAEMYSALHVRIWVAAFVPRGYYK